MYYYPGFGKNPNNRSANYREVIDVSRKLVELGLNRGTSGNVSVRTSSGLMITPSGVPVGELTPDVLVDMDMAGNVRGEGKPSSEWRFHLDIYRGRSDVGAVVHTHAMFATTIACLRKDVPPFHYMIASVGGDSLRCAPYALFGSQELSEHVLHALKERKACLLANHGMISVGKNLSEALSVAVEVETLCEQYTHLLQIGDEPVLLSSDEMTEVMHQFQGYGRWGQ